MHRLLSIIILTLVFHFTCLAYAGNETSAFYQEKSHVQLYFDNKPLRVGVVHMCPPYLIQKDSTYAGFLIDLVDTIMCETQYHYQYVVDSYDHLMHALQIDSLDLVFGCPQIDSLSSQMVYSIPYEEVHYKMGRLPQTDVHYSILDPTQKMKVAICQEDAVIAKRYVSHFDRFDLHIFPSISQAAYAVYTKQCDCLVCKTRIIVPRDTTTHEWLVWDYLPESKHTFYSACVKLDDYKIMRAVNSAVLHLRDQAQISQYKQKWFGFDKYTDEFMRMQNYLRMAVVVCILLFIGCLVALIYLAVLSLKSKYKRNYMQRLLSKIPIPLFILKSKKGDICYEYINDVAKTEQYSSRNSCTAEQLMNHRKRLKKAYELAIDTLETVSFVDRRKPDAPYSIYVSGCQFEGETCAVKTVVNTQELLLLKEQAEENAQKVDDFLATISHEVRTPLNAILGFCQLLPEIPLEERPEILAIIDKKSKQLHKLINDILLLAKLESGALTCRLDTCAFDAWTHNMVEAVLCNMDLQSSVPIIVDPAPGDGLLQTDKELLSVLLSNLLQNAIRFTVEGEIHVGYFYAPHYVVYYVQDTGIGMSQSDSLNVFNRFVKVNSFTQGTGLGMPIVSAISYMFNGHIGVYSQLRKGTTCYFFCPCKSSCSDLQNYHAALPKIERAVWINGKPHVLQK